MISNSLRHTDSTEDREQALQRLARDDFDVLIIGGGITGAAIARAAAHHKLRVALIDKNDFAGGTSSRSSRLIHGGLRYLKHGHVRLVRRSQREQQYLSESAPHLVQPLPLLVPLYRNQRSQNPVVVSSAMILYRLLQPFRARLHHAWISERSLHDTEPLLAKKNMWGGFICREFLTHDARLVWENVLSAVEAGGCAANYVRVLQLDNSRGRVAGATLRDELTGMTLETRARFVVNAAGPWSDAVTPNLNGRQLRLSKGVHIFLPQNRLPLSHAVVLYSPRDARPMVAIPAANFVLVGPTETEFRGAPDQVEPDREDIAYLLETLNEFFPEAGLRETDVIAARAGLRPLYDQKAKAAGYLSREYHIECPRDGLLSVLGGKLTLHRQAAKEAVTFLLRELGSNHSQPRGGAPLLPGAVWHRKAGAVAEGLSRAGASAQSISHLLSTYGSRAALFEQLLSQDPDLRMPIISGLPHLRAEAIFSQRYEKAVCAEDFLERRTDFALCAKGAGVDAAALVSEFWRPDTSSFVRHA